jgi:hypothetical protein
MTVGVHGAPFLRGATRIRSLMPTAQPPPPTHDRAQGAAAIKDPADYEAITRTAPYLTELSLKLPGSATALPQQMASLLSACSKLEDLALHAYNKEECRLPVSRLLDLSALLAAGSQLLHLRLPNCHSLTNLAPLRGLVNLHSLNIRSCKMSDLAPLGALVNLQSLDISFCKEVSDLAPLGALVNLKSLVTCYSNVSNLAPLGALVTLQSLNISSCFKASDLGPLTDLVNLQSLDMSCCYGVSDLAPLGALLSLQSLEISYCQNVSDLAPLTALVSLQSLGMSCCYGVSDLAPLAALLSLQSLDLSFCRKVSDLAPLGALVKLQKLIVSKGDEDKVAPIQNQVDRGELQVVYSTRTG